MFCVGTIVLVRPELDLSIIDVDTEQSQAGAGRHTDRVPDPRAPGGKNIVFLKCAWEPQDRPAFPGIPEYFLERVGTATEYVITGLRHVATW